MFRTTLPIFVLFALAACGQEEDGVLQQHFDNRDDAIAAASRVSGDATTGLAACAAISYTDTTGLHTAQMIGFDGDLDTKATIPGSWTDVFADRKYVCTLDTVPYMYVTITTAADVGADCNDSSASIYTGAIEACDGADNDCDGAVDESGGTATYYADADHDGYGDSAVTSTACSMPVGFVVDATDCDDRDVFTFPGAAELDSTSACMADADADGYGDDSVSGSVTAGTDCSDAVTSTHPGAMDNTCDGVDNDCDHVTDEDATYTDYYVDMDGDGYGSGSAHSFCAPPSSGYSLLSTDCDDGVLAISPAATEVCDLVDNNCTGGIDEGVEHTFYADTDHDTYGDPAVTDMACSAPVGYVSDSTDCDDSTALRYPGNPEVCDGIDNDCASGADNGLAFVAYYTDVDRDGYGSGTASSMCSNPGTGYSTLNTDCNDLSGAISPAGSEVCDSGTADEDCDGLVDDNDPSATGQSTWYADLDGDGFGLSASGTTSKCDMPSGYSAVSTDCDNSDADTYPGSAEEESLSACMTDADDDGFGDEDATVGVPGTDCNDTDSAVNPDATDVANNGLDDNCDNTAVDYVCEWDTFTNSAVYKQLWLDSQDTTSDDSTWNYPGLASGTASSTTELCVNRTITGGEDWKVQVQYSTSATSGTFYSSSWSFSGYGNGYTNVSTLTVMDEPVTVTKTSWGGGADGYFTVAATLPN